MAVRGLASQLWMPGRAGLGLPDCDVQGSNWGCQANVIACYECAVHWKCLKSLIAQYSATTLS
eukprot:40299-Pelagomonas_calceolata.AAC.1